MIEMVSLAEARLARNRKAVFVTAQLPQTSAALAAVARSCAACEPPGRQDPGRVAAAGPRIPRHRGGQEFSSDGAGARRYSQSGVVTPDQHHPHKNWPLPSRAGRRQGGSFRCAAAARG